MTPLLMGVVIVLALAFLGALGFGLGARQKVMQARMELEQCRQMATLREATLQHNLEEKVQEMQRALAEKEGACEQRLKDREAACAQLIADRDALQEKSLREKERSLEELKKTIEGQFVAWAAQALKTQEGDLARNHTLQLEGVLKPLREQVDRLHSATEKTQREHVKLAESMEKRVGEIREVAQGLSEVSQALSSHTGFQGRKGEEILAEKLRQAGLEENVNFFLQTGTAADRPDAQVCDTENRWLIIDSKVILTAYFQYVEAKDEATRKAKLKEHIARVREKIDQLARKKYACVFAAEHPDRNYLPVTAMFVPYEAPLLEALKVEPSLWKYAVENNVILVTPLTLLAYLRLVYLAWQHEKEARHQAEIVSVARELLTRLNAFLVAFESVGKGLTDLQAKYEDARGVLVDAPRAQTIAKAANRLLELHVRLEGRKGKRLEKAACLKELEESLEDA